MRIAGETLGVRGAIALSATAVVAAVLALHGYGHPGALGLTGATSPVGGHPTAPSSTPTPKGSPSSGASPSPSSSATPGPLLSSTAYGPYAYEIYPNPPSANAKLALAGFSFTTNPSGSSVRFTLSVTGGGKPQSKTYPISDRIYFIEASFGDDSGNAEYNFGDDGVVATDSTGHVVQ